MAVGEIGQIEVIEGGLAIGVRLKPHDISATGSDIPGALRNLADKMEREGVTIQPKGK